MEGKANWWRKNYFLLIRSWWIRLKTENESSGDVPDKDIFCFYVSEFKYKSVYFM